MNHASPLSLLRVSLAAGIGFASMLTAAACGSNSTLPAQGFGSSSGGTNNGNLDATASSSGGSSSGSSSNYNNNPPSNGSASSSGSGGTMCVSTCKTDSDCQNSCPTPSSGTNCCDTSSSTCFMSPNAACTPSQTGSE